jgi:hypothetical protein
MISICGPADKLRELGIRIEGLPGLHRDVSPASSLAQRRSGTVEESCVGGIVTGHECRDVVYSMVRPRSQRGA